jgi:hypothetical protein
MDMNETPMSMGRPMYYRLDADHNVMPATRGEMIAMFNAPFEDTRRVAETEVGEARVSTVFLGLDHGWSGGPPEVFETMIFGGSFDEYQWRYATWDAAAAGHKRIVVALTEGVTP